MHNQNRKLQCVPKKRTNKTNKNGQTWQACQHSKVVQRGQKGFDMTNLDVFDYLGPFWACPDPFGPFQTKNYFLHKRTSAKSFGPFWTPLDHFGMLTSLPRLPFFVCFIGAFFGTPCSLVYPLGAAILNLSVYRLTSGSFRTNLAIL